jgi:EAL domain-containing protein (putative c-di-GMP-specific phosphodiesterase class I)/PleD family two-component response regulator
MDIKQLRERTVKFSVLYVEDDVEVRTNTQEIFEDLFLSVECASNGEEGLKKYEEKAYDILITDVNMPIMNGIELIRRVKKLNPYQIIIVVSAYNETEYFLDGIQSGIDGYLLKPVDYEQLFATFDKIAKILEDRKENQQSKDNMQKVIQEKTRRIEQNYEKMQHMLLYDRITNLPNANVFYQYLDSYESYTMNLMLFKIDNFSYLTQTYEKEICNEIIQNCAKFLSLNFEKNVKFYHYSNEEFILISYEKTKEYFLNLVTQIQAFFKETPVAKSKKGHDIYVTFSIAIILNQEALNILQKAKATLNKLNMLNTYGSFAFYEQDDSFIKEAGENWSEKIRDIIDNDRVIPYFQPIVSNITKQIARYECLMRANDDGKIITPIRFLDAVRKAGLMSNLSKIMINKCFSFFAYTDIEFSINLTYEDLLDEKFIDFIFIKQQQYGIKSSNVIFEILEDIIIDTSCKTPIKNLKKLKEHGFLLALDDFGADRSNFNRFASIVDLDYIKIDGSFIKDISKNEKNFKIVRSIVTLARQINIQTVAEFVSTKQDYDVVRDLGIEYSQGYYFYEPSGEMPLCKLY